MQPADEVPQVCLRVAEEQLQLLLASGSTSRATALDLLSVDALVTYAFEAAAANGQSIEACASHAMARIAMLAMQESVR
ncbi:MAG: hypothetical protein M3Y64_10420 [Gemmatimonadota bacterium]|nr:hypothetical protein [Gemmatimonadota bacterium]